MHSLKIGKIHTLKLKIFRFSQFHKFFRGVRLGVCVGGNDRQWVSHFWGGEGARRSAVFSENQCLFCWEWWLRGSWGKRRWDDKFMQRQINPFDFKHDWIIVNAHWNLIFITYLAWREHASMLFHCVVVALNWRFCVILWKEPDSTKDICIFILNCSNWYLPYAVHHNLCYGSFESRLDQTSFLR